MKIHAREIDDRELKMPLGCQPWYAVVDPRFSATAFVCLCVFVNFGALPGFSGTLPKLTVPAKVTVTGEQVTLGGLMKIDPADARLSAHLDSVILTLAPAPGRTKMVTAHEILRRLESIGVTGKSHTITTPAEVVIVCEAQTVTAAEISQRVVEEFLPRLPWKDVQLERIDVAEAILLPKGKTEWIFNSQPGTDYAKPFYLNITFIVNGEVAKRAFLRTVFSLREQVAVVLTDLKPSQSIREEDVRWEPQRLMSTLETPVRSSSFFRGRRLRTPISQGRVLTENLFITVPLIKRGDNVVLIFENASMRLTTQAKALAMGFRGQRIQVMNTESGKVLSAEVTDEGMARVLH